LREFLQVVFVVFGNVTNYSDL
jgi:hypothetical protein